MDQQYRIPADGRCVRPVFERTWHRYDSNGRILPFCAKAFTVMQYMAWALLFLITVWQLFRVFGGPITEAENPLSLLARSSLFAF